MFGCLVAGKLVQTNFQQVSESKYVFLLPDALSIQHLCVFLLGTTPLPPGYGATVYIAWPPNYDNWMYLGYITNEKPSAVFRVKSNKPEPQQTLLPSFAFGGVPHQSPNDASVVAQLGISIEPLSLIESLVAQQGKPKPLANESKAMAKKMLENFYNFATSFATDKPQEPTYIPVSVLEKWYQSFERKIDHDPTFLLDNNTSA